MNPQRNNPAGSVRGKWFFLGSFIFACFLFWWLPSILFRIIFHQSDAVDDETIVISLLALGLFIAGYLLPMSGCGQSRLPEQMLEACGAFAYKAAVIIFYPALMICIYLYHSHAAVDYGSADPIPRPFQALLYTHLFFGFMYLGAANPEKQGWRRIWMIVILVSLPRLIESLHGGRFFFAQAAVPAVLIAVARGWFRISLKRMLQFVALALVIIIVPALTRGSTLSGQQDVIEFFNTGTLHLYQSNTDLSLNGYCQPLFVSTTDMLIPYKLLGVCLLDYYAGLRNMPATLGRILTNNDPGSFLGTKSGTGSIYLLELYLFGGISAVLIGSAFFGFSCRRFWGWIGRRSLFSGIWAECLTRALFAPRSDLGYVYERIPSLVLATFLVIFIVWAGRLLQHEQAANIAIAL